MNTLHKQSACTLIEKTLTHTKIPYGYCHCGCGRKAPIIDITQRAQGRVKGEPSRYIAGHHKRHPRRPSRIVLIDKIRYRTVPLTRGMEAIVNIGDFHRISKYTWYVSVERGRIYACASVSGVQVRMHDFILNPPDGKETDHWNGNTLDNRRCNLRAATRTQTNFNKLKKEGGSSRYKGVCRNSRDRNWGAEVHINGKKTFLGSFKSEIDAAESYDIFVRNHVGEFGTYNFPKRGERSAISGKISGRV